MKHKFLVVLMAIATAFCMAFGFTACGEKNPDETGNNPPITDPSGGNQGEQGSQGNQGEQGGTQKPDEGEQGGTQKPDEGEQGGTQKPDESEQEPETYTEGLCFTEMYGEDGTTVIPWAQVKPQARRRSSFPPSTTICPCSRSAEARTTKRFGISSTKN